MSVGYRRKISIHLMFLLIGITLETTCLSCYFNTSHVSINRKAAEDDLLDIRYFNTSHVSINQVTDSLVRKLKKAFQYISCFY